MNRSLLSFLLLLCSFIAAAQAETQHKLVIYLNDGNTADFVLAEQPKITFSGDNLCVTSPTATIEILCVAVKNFKFEKCEENENSIEAPHSDINITTQKESITLTGLTNGEIITVYSIDGKAITKATAIDGHCTIALDSLTSGIYLININTTTIKYLKK